MVHQEKNLTIRISKELSNNYNDMCKKNGYTLSKRLRSLLELDIELDKINKNLINLK